MSQKLVLDGKEYSAEDIGEAAQAQLVSFQFTEQRIQELTNMMALLQRAKNSYVDALKKEMLSSKAGYLIDTD